jgi:hypothetical protein
MKDNGDVAQDWLRKAESDFAAAELCLDRARRSTMPVFTASKRPKNR